MVAADVGDARVLRDGVVHDLEARRQHERYQCDRAEQDSRHCAAAIDPPEARGVVAVVARRVARQFPTLHSRRVGVS